MTLWLGGLASAGRAGGALQAGALVLPTGKEDAPIAQLKRMERHRPHFGAGVERKRAHGIRPERIFIIAKARRAYIDNV